MASPNADDLVVVQISDLHVGDSLQRGVLNRNAGTRGHDPTLCRLLSTRLRFVAANHRCQPSEVKWIVNGDLTRVGADAEFGVVRDFLESVPACDRFGRPLLPTLGIPRDRYLDVPGNHDHFNGWDEQGMVQPLVHPPPAWNANIFPDLFTPTVCDNRDKPWMSSRGSIKLEIFGVDSNSGLAGRGANRSAKGEISDGEFALLEDSLQQSNDDELAECANVTRLRAIVCHHAFTKVPQPGWLKASPLADVDVDRLTKLAATYRVAALLTGHTHHFHFRKLRVPTIRHRESELREYTVYEIRCPTTLQGPADPLVNGFWVHHLSRPSPADGVIWRPTLYMLAAARLHAHEEAGADVLVLP